MCHYYGNALSVLNAAPGDSQLPSELLDPQHFQAIRMLPSFRNLIESLVDAGDVLHARALLEDDSALFEKVQKSLDSKDRAVLQLLRAIHIVGLSSSGLVDNIALYITGFDGTFGDSNFVRHALESIKHMAPDDLNSFIKSIRHALYDGVPEMELDSWASEELEFLGDITEIHRRVTALLDESSKTGKPVRSSYAIHSKGIRTTVIAQRVQLSYEKSTLSDQDKEFTSLVDRLSEVLGKYFNPAKPQDLFMSEIWLYDSTSPYRDVFTPRPRAAVERALSLPHNYLNCECCESVEALSSTQPATAILYQMYLETGSLINVFDLWSAFLEMISSGEEEKCDERDALVLFYRALGDLKVSGMVKQSKRKADHLAKAAWEGL
jgi:origin recognition complex subunit 3